MQTKTPLPDGSAPRSSPRSEGGPGSSASSGRRAFRPVSSAFSAYFLDRARRRDDSSEPGESPAETPLARQARWSGPWEVSRVPAGDSVVHVVARKGEEIDSPDELDSPNEADRGARLAFLRRQDALLAAASLAAVAAPAHLSLGPGKKRGRLGHPVHEGSRHLGHVSPAVHCVEREFLAAFHTVRSLAASPEAVALLIQALDTETLGILGRAIMRRLE